MSLTNKEKEIALNLVKSEDWPENWHEELANLVLRGLSRIREEQEAVAWMQSEPINPSFLRVHPSAKVSGSLWTIPLFTTPPASPEFNCDELVEALEKIAANFGDRYTAQEALANHAKRMKGEE